MNNQNEIAVAKPARLKAHVQFLKNLTPAERKRIVNDTNNDRPFIPYSLWNNLATYTEEEPKIINSKAYVNKKNQQAKIDDYIYSYLDNLDSNALTGLEKRYLKSLKKIASHRLNSKNFLVQQIYKTLKSIYDFFSPINPLLKAVYNIGKKVLDIIDEGWQAVQKFLPRKFAQTVGPYLTGILGVIYFVGETIGAAKEIFSNIFNPRGQRKSKLASSIISIGLTLTGLGLSIALIAAGLGASLVIAPFIPLILSGLTLGVIAVNQARRHYSLYCIKKETREAQHSLQDLIKNHNISINQPEHINSNHVKELISNLRAQIDSPHLDDRQKEKLSRLSSQLIMHLAHEEYCKEKHAEVERRVAFGLIELLTYSLVMVGVVLLTAAVIGLSVGTLGVAPNILIGAGVLLGIGVMSFQYIDKFFEHKASNAIRHGCAKALSSLSGGLKNLWNRCLGKKPLKDNTSTVEATLSLASPAHTEYSTQPESKMNGSTSSIFAVVGVTNVEQRKYSSSIPIQANAVVEEISIPSSLHDENDFGLTSPRYPIYVSQ